MYFNMVAELWHPHLRAQLHENNNATAATAALNVNDGRTTRDTLQDRPRDFDRLVDELGEETAQAASTNNDVFKDLDETRAHGMMRRSRRAHGCRLQKLDGCSIMRAPSMLNRSRGDSGPGRTTQMLGPPSSIEGAVYPTRTQRCNDTR